MRILFLSPRQILPARSGAKLREYHFLHALGRSAELTYLYFVDPGHAPLTLDDLPFCSEVVAVPKPPAYGVIKTVKGILGRWPLPILNYTSPEMSARIAERMAISDFDAIHLDSIHMMRYALAAVERRRSLKTIFSWHNIESEAMQRYASTDASSARRWYARYTANRMAVLEVDILGSATGHIVCSEREREKLLQTSPSARIAVVENGVDTAYFAGNGEGASGHRIVFVGAMDYPPNSDAAIFFARRIWPQVRNRLSDAELLIVGSMPGPAVLALGELPGVKVTGFVPDVRPYYRQALAAIVPLRTGGGTRLKILEGMAAGVPVISTPLGAEGLEVTDGKNILLVDSEDANGWVSRITDLAESSAKREELVRGGLRLVQSRYDWEISGAKLRETYRDWVGGDNSTSER